MWRFSSGAGVAAAGGAGVAADGATGDDPVRSRVGPQEVPEKNRDSGCACTTRLFSGSLDPDLDVAALQLELGDVLLDQELD